VCVYERETSADGPYLVQEVFEQIVAGSDTTAAAIRVILLYVMSHPRVYAKLRAEIDETVKKGMAPESPSIISDTEVRQLPYLGAVVREGMRVSLHVGFMATFFFFGCA
jgi:cytochrome P450